jgi:hypothetical protein
MPLASSGTRRAEPHQHAHHDQHQVVDWKDAQRAANQKALEFGAEAAAVLLDAQPLRRKIAARRPEKLPECL